MEKHKQKRYAFVILSIISSIVLLIISPMVISYEHFFEIGFHNNSDITVEYVENTKITITDTFTVDYDQYGAYDVFLSFRVGAYGEFDEFYIRRIDYILTYNDFPSIDRHFGLASYKIVSYSYNHHMSLMNSMYTNYSGIVEINVIIDNVTYSVFHDLTGYYKPNYDYRFLDLLGLITGAVWITYLLCFGIFPYIFYTIIKPNFKYHYRKEWKEEDNEFFAYLSKKNKQEIP